MWQSTMEFLSRCVDKGARVETMVYPGQKHGLVGKSYAHFLRKMTRFFQSELGRERAYSLR